MDSGLCVSEESGGKHCGGDGSLPPGVTPDAVCYVRFSYDEDMPLLEPVLYEFQKRVNGNDFSHVVDFDAGGGVTIPMHEMELFMCQLRAERVRFQLAVSAGECVGFLMYHIYADCILMVRGIYVLPECEGAGLGKGLIDSLGLPIRKVIFQTQTGAAPMRVLSHTVARRRELHRDEKLATWEMDWGASQ